MGTVTTKQLKQNTGEIIKRVRSGERLTIAYRGKPVAIMASPTNGEIKILRELRPFDEAWADIERTLETTKPRFRGWKEATKWARNRT